MPRQPRKFSNSRVYHIMYKGLDGKDIFYDESDNKVFLNIILELKKDIQFKLYAYCLMSNHVHLVIKIEDILLSKAMKSLGLRYALYFNKKYIRSGPLFQNRFNSKCVENQNYFLKVCKYVHQNPEKAGICITQNYKWSSYHEYLGNEKLIDKKVLLHYFNNNLDEFMKFNTNKDLEDDYQYIEYEFKTKLEDSELVKLILKKLKIQNINDIAKMKKSDRKEKIKILKDLKYTSIRQIARITGIERKVIERIFSKEGKNENDKK